MPYGQEDCETELAAVRKQRDALMTLIDMLDFYGGKAEDRACHDLGHLICGEGDRTPRWPVLDAVIADLRTAAPHSVARDIANRLEDIRDRYGKSEAIL